MYAVLACKAQSGIDRSCKPRLEWTAQLMVRYASFRVVAHVDDVAHTTGAVWSVAYALEFRSA